MNADNRRLPTLSSQISGVIAILFGLATLAAGTAVLTGRDPGYLVYRPLLMFNTIMGVVYLLAGVLAWRRAPSAWKAAAGIAGVNIAVLIYVVMLYRGGGPTAVDSVRAMSLRAAVWVVLTVVLLWSSRARRGPAV